MPHWKGLFLHLPRHLLPHLEGCSSLMSKLTPSFAQMSVPRHDYDVKLFWFSQITLIVLEKSLCEAINAIVTADELTC